MGLWSFVVLFVLMPLLLGWVLDMLMGDPTNLPHPVVLFGKLISTGERWLNNGEHRVWKGALLAGGLIVLTGGISWLLLTFLAEYASRGELLFGIILILLQTYCIFSSLAGTTLIREVQMVFHAVDRSLEDGRKQVARIVGRDTRELSAQEVRTAALETLAENLSDGVVAPLFWFAFLGVPGMLAYKMVNTLDSMIGYRTERYRMFGCPAARIDDVANYIPARLTALLMMISACLLYPQRVSFIRLWKFVGKYGKEHASPNSGYPEATLAGVLDCRFGGPHFYFGEYFPKPYIGVNDRELTTADMVMAVKINRLSEILMMAIVILFIIVTVCLGVFG